MIEKRFTETPSLMIVTDNQTGKEYKCEMGIDTDLLDVLNTQHEKIEHLKEENKKLLKKNDIDFRWHQNYQELDKDELYIKDNNTEIRLKNRNLFINVFIPDINEYFKINYVVTGKKLTRW